MRVVLPASGWEMMANVRRLFTSSWNPRLWDVSVITPPYPSTGTVQRTVFAGDEEGGGGESALQGHHTPS